VPQSEGGPKQGKLLERRKKIALALSKGLERKFVVRETSGGAVDGEKTLCALCREKKKNSA